MKHLLDFQEFDINKDGVISYKEFRRAMETQKMYTRCVLSAGSLPWLTISIPTRAPLLFRSALIVYIFIILTSFTYVVLVLQAFVTHVPDSRRIFSCIFVLLFLSVPNNFMVNSNYFLFLNACKILLVFVSISELYREFSVAVRVSQHPVCLYMGLKYVTHCSLGSRSKVYFCDKWNKFDKKN